MIEGILSKIKEKAKAFCGPIKFKVTNIVVTFKNLPIKTQKLMGLGITLCLVVALPLFVFAALNVTRFFGRAASGEPSGEPPSPTATVSSFPTPTCRPRPACLDAKPHPCLPLEPVGGWCPSPTPTPSCMPRPACIDAYPHPCKLPEPLNGWCPVGSPTPIPLKSPAPKLTPTKAPSPRSVYIRPPQLSVIIRYFQIQITNIQKISGAWFTRFTRILPI